MRQLLIPLLAATALAQSPQVLTTHTTESLRGASAVSRNIAWASGTHGTYLRTTDGVHWQPAQVPDATALDFRAVVAFSTDEAFLMSSGPGDQSRIYHTADAGHHWQLQFTNSNPKGFFDSMLFWDKTHGIVLGDPIPDETGKLKFELLLTDDGQTWRPIPPAQLPAAERGEGAFAASNTCLAILVSPQFHPVTSSQLNSVILSGADRRAKRIGPRSRRTPFTLGESAASQGVLTPISFAPSFWVAQRFSAAISDPPNEAAAPTPDPNIWFATGGRVARVFHSPDRGQTWQVTSTPILHGPDSAGIFSIAFRDATHGAIAGGDYKHPNQDGPNLAFTTDGGKTWTLSPLLPQAFFSAVAYDRNPGQNKERIFIVGQNFVFDFRPPHDPTRISPRKKSTSKFNALTPYPEGGALIVGPNGTIATIP